MIDVSQALEQGRVGDEKSLSKTFEFEDFIQAMKFVNSVADIAESYNHHPGIDITRNKVTLKTTTHDAGDRITDKDLEIIIKIEKI